MVVVDEVTINPICRLDEVASAFAKQFLVSAECNPIFPKFEAPCFTVYFLILRWAGLIKCCDWTAYLPP